MFICQTFNSDRFLETLFCTRSFTSQLRFGSLNMLLTLPVEEDCVGKAKPVTLFDWMKANVYPKCLKIESANTATLVHAPVCVHAAQSSEWYACAWNTKWRWVRIEFPPSPDSDRSPEFEKHWFRVSFGTGLISGSALTSERRFKFSSWWFDALNFLIMKDKTWLYQI